MTDRVPAAVPEPPLSGGPLPVDAGYVMDEPAETLKEHLSTWLSTTAIVLITVGIVWGVWGWAGPWSLCVGGAVLAALVSVADASRRPSTPAPAVAPVLRRQGPPGPSDPGNMHTRGPGSRA